MNKTKIKIIFLLCSITAASAVAAPRRFTTKLATGPIRTCAISNDGLVKCWGENYQGVLAAPGKFRIGGDPGTMGFYLNSVDLGRDFFALDICTAGYHACALNSNHQIKCWGRNREGQLGQGHNKAEVGVVASELGEKLLFTNLGENFASESLSCGSEHVCALAEDGTGKCWGGNSGGELGLDRERVSIVGSQADQMGEHLAKLPFANPIKKLVAGPYFTCAMFADEVVCWGENSSGQIGIESSERYISLEPDGSNRPVKLEDQGVPILMKDVVIGDRSACAIYNLHPASGRVSEEKLKCWGSNRYGELGVGSAQEQIGSEVGTMGSRLPDVRLNLASLVKVSMGRSFSCALDSLGQAKCWGNNHDGALGLGDLQTRGKSPIDMGAQLPTIDLGLPILGLSDGAWDQSCAVLINHQVKCWGSGNGGILGTENQDDIGGKAQDMGSYLPFVNIW